eukprot:CAMPEP_0182595802 /NCGR_PEP_ID=MMETSP1324-20130603/82985_1 /TAXON_ID=236786 /ORGANISM="Florenciella sp., Strain RCC1587" /LENGTH=51 /DNA_ID=CAMNT_0024813431 /DNA_START=95 /DNA_END=250 /DNA_ORIENTATION=-
MPCMPTRFGLGRGQPRKLVVDGRARAHPHGLREGRVRKGTLDGVQPTTLAD